MQRPNVLHDVLAAPSAQHRLGVGHELGLQSRIRHGVLLRAAGVVDMGFKAGSVFERDTHMGFIAAEILYRLDLYFVPQSNDCGVGCPCIAVLCQTGYAVQAGDCRAVVRLNLDCKPVCGFSMPVMRTVIGLTCSAMLAMCPKSGI